MELADRREPPGDRGRGEAPAVEIAGKLSGIKLSASGGGVIDVLNVGELPVTSITQINGSQA